MECGVNQMTSVFERLLNMSITGSIVIAVVLLARLCLKRAPKIYSYLLWSVVLFRLLCPVSFSSDVSVLEPVPGRSADSGWTVSYQPLRQADQIETRPQAEATPEGLEHQKTEQPKGKVTPMDIGAWVWLLGAVGMGGFSLAQYALLRRRLAEAVPLGGNVYLCDRIASPFVMGLFRPNIYLPSETPEEERSFILAHERYHIRRVDPVWKALAYLALCIHWFNPLAWLAFCLAGKDMELSCDEAVLKGLGVEVRADYAQALLRLATHKRVFSGMPLAFGEGDTKGRIRNMARWKRPKVWVSALCGAVLLVTVAVCAMNPRQGKPLEELTRISGPAGIGVGDFYCTLPEGYTMEARELEQAKTGDGIMQVITDGTNVLGGVLHFEQGTIQENITALYRALGVPEEEPLGYMSGGSAGKNVTISIFSDVPEGQPRLVQHQHNLYYWGDLIYDLWFDEQAMPQDIMESLLNSVSLGGQLTYSSGVIPYEIGDLPQGLSSFVDGDGSIWFRKGEAIVGGIADYPIPQGVYDPMDEVFLWLQDVGIPDYEDETLMDIGMFTFGGDSCNVTFADDSEPPTVKRTHIFHVTSDTVYDFWWDELQLSREEQDALKDAVRYVQPTLELSEDLPEEELAYRKCKTVMNGIQEAQDGGIQIRTLRHSGNTPEEDYTEDFYYAPEVGFLRLTTTAQGETRGELERGERYFTCQGGTWTETQAPEVMTGPWLGAFYFVKHYVTYDAAIDLQEGTGYMFRVNAPFDESPDAAPNYFACFDFDPEDNFTDVFLQINPVRDNSYTLTESVVSTDAQAVSARIQAAFEEATK